MAKVQTSRARADGYNPVLHTDADTQRLLAKPGVKAAYDALEDDYSALHAILLARTEAGSRTDGR